MNLFRMILFKSMRAISGVLLALFVVGSVFAQQSPSVTGITRMVIAKRQAAFGGAAFGSAGAYEVVAGTAYGELDPRASGNTGIVNVNLAPLNSRGHVEYSVDFMILKPVDAKKGNGRLIYDFVNRGRNTILRLDESGDSFAPGDTGNAFLLNRGYTVAWTIQPCSTRRERRSPCASVKRIRAKRCPLQAGISSTSGTSKSRLRRGSIAARSTN